MANFNSRSTADEVLSTITLKGKDVVVTGANTGIGFEAARALAASGANVIFACRSPQKGIEAVNQAKKRHPHCNAEFAELDLSSFESIQQFCNSLKIEKIDILLNNAGLMLPQYATTREGIEMTVGVSHFGHFLLTTTLLHLLLATNESRVVMVSSESHRFPRKLDFDNFPMNETTFKMWSAYGQAKLCNLLFANELQRRYGDKGLTACSIHPGNAVTTNIGHDSFLTSLGIKLISPFTKSPNQGAATSVFCAAYETKENIAGKYFSHCKVSRNSSESKNPEVAKRLWGLSEKVINQQTFNP